jgi:hypothetical protein
MFDLFNNIKLGILKGTLYMLSKLLGFWIKNLLSTLVSKTIPK